MAKESRIERSFSEACAKYADYGVDAKKALKILSSVKISLHCWQGDDVRGFEHGEAGLSDSGLQATGNYPGRARTADELRADLEMAMSMIPGKHRVNLHSIYAEHGTRRIERNELTTKQFARWIDWAREQGLGLDFNGSFFSHPMVKDGFTLSHPDKAVRRFWIEHGQACRKIGADMGKALGTPCVTNIWIPDGYKDIPADRKGPRERLKDSLDEVLKEKLNPAHNLDAAEGKLFGIGSESYVVGSHEFYLAYAISRRILLCLDAGHFHPTETIADKLSAVFTFLDRVLLHVSRGVRWDSDHVVILSDELKAIAEELVRGDYLGRVHIGLDYFDASINRVAAWTIGARNMLKALLLALLEPSPQLRMAEKRGDLTARLALLEEIKMMPVGAVWQYYCASNNVPVGGKWLEEVRAYERSTMLKR